MLPGPESRSVEAAEKNRKNVIRLMSFGVAAEERRKEEKKIVYISKQLHDSANFFFFVNSIFPRQENKVRKRSIINGKFRFD